MHRRTLLLALTAALVSLVLGYGLLGLAAPDAGSGSSEAVAVGSLDLTALASTFTGPDGVAPRIVVVDETALTPANVRGDHDDDHDDHDDDDHDDDDDDDDDDDRDDHGADDDD